MIGPPAMAREQCSNWAASNRCVYGGPCKVVAGGVCGWFSGYVVGVVRHEPKYAQAFDLYKTRVEAGHRMARKAPSAAQDERGDGNRCAGTKTQGRSE